MASNAWAIAGLFGLVVGGMALVGGDYEVDAKDAFCRVSPSGNGTIHDGQTGEMDTYLSNRKLDKQYKPGYCALWETDHYILYPVRP